ncbi:hypothetical protein HDU98_008778 [Podochytrium sp. JEL0797]|nr:hypothetical protein HDU98_008778 [Podochytrium sp. JEL0797]
MYIPPVHTFLGGFLALLIFALLFSPLWGPLVYCYIQRMRVIKRQEALEIEKDEARFVKDVEAMGSLNRVGTLLSKQTKDWSVKQVSKFLRRRGVEESVCAKLREHNIDGQELLELTDEQLEREMKVASAEIRLAVLAEIQKLKEATYV